MENRLAIHYALVDLWRRRAYGKMFHEHGSSNRASKESASVAQIIDDALSRPTHSRMACVDGCGLSSAEERKAHDEEGDRGDNGLSKLHDCSLLFMVPFVLGGGLSEAHAGVDP
jgi:hypothetical protein